MDIERILRAIDHTNLRQDAGWSDIRTLCDEGMIFSTASVCIPPSYVRQAADYVQGNLVICTVIGFPNGYSAAAAKCFEAEDAVKNGAGEIDMVINIGWLKDKKYNAVLDEIRQIKNACGGKLLKVIIETCLLTEEEKIRMCEIVSDSGADYIKTSTGFSAGGATREDVALLKKHIAGHVKIKAAGGIKTLRDAQDFLDLGASRLGTSSIVRSLAKQQSE